MNNPVFFVDGKTEQRIVQNLCPGTKVQLINCNGSKVSIQSICNRLATLIRLLNNKYHPIIIIIDREDRIESVEIIIQSIINDLSARGIKDDIRISVCDRMIENWILHDIGSLNIDQYDNPDLEIEGKHGKNIMRKHIPNYHEATDGVNLFLKMSPEFVYKNSNSFRAFVDSIKDLNCNWLRFLVQ